MLSDLIEALEKYIPFNEQEENDKILILHELKNNPDVLERTSLHGHITASAWVVNKEKTKVLMAYHNIYDSWAWLGGHADGDDDLMHVALKETMEESGVCSPRPLSDEIFSVEAITVDGHEKRGKYVPSHVHFNFTFLICADENETTHAKEDENSGVRWFTFAEAMEASNEKWIKNRIYRKLIDKLN